MKKIKRNTLKGVAIAFPMIATLPSAWIRPVINSVLLPAHAQTSVSISMMSVLNVNNLASAVSVVVTDTSTNTEITTLTIASGETNTFMQAEDEFLNSQFVATNPDCNARQSNVVVADQTVSGNVITLTYNEGGLNSCPIRRSDL